MDDYESMASFFEGFMVDQRSKGASGSNGEQKAQQNGVSRKAQYSGTLPGTNGLRASKETEQRAMKAGDDAVQGVGGV